MAWTTYKGLTVPSSTTGDAGGYLSSDLEALADRVGPCNFTATSNPTSSDGATEGYEVGSFWVNTSTNTWFVCVNNTPSAAVWSGGTVTETKNADGSGNLTFTNAAVNVWYGMLNTHNTGATQTLTVPNGMAVPQTVQLTIDGTIASGYALFELPDSTYLYVGNELIVSATLAWNGANWVNTTPQEGLTETQIADSDGSVTFNNPNADIYYAILIGVAVEVTTNVTLPIPSGPRVARLIIDSSSEISEPPSVSFTNAIPSSLPCVAAYSYCAVIDLVYPYETLGTGTWMVALNFSSGLSAPFISLPGLPNSPGASGSGVVWNDSGTLKVS